MKDAAARILLSAALLVLAGCANYQYVGEKMALDSEGEERQTLLYWHKTAPLIGAAKADSAVLRTACGTPVTFVDRSQGIVFVGTPGDDRPAGVDTSVTQGQVCGRILDHSSLLDIEPGALRVSMQCEPLVDDFSVNRAYLAAREAPYVFEMEEQKRLSLFGNPFAAPVPECQ